MIDFIIAAVLVIVVGLAVLYIYKARKSGKKCIGCPDSYFCSRKDKGDCSGSKDE